VRITTFFGFIDFCHRVLPAGFYYKTFMAPNWHRYEPAIRRMAGLGRLRETVDELHYETRYAALRRPGGRRRTGWVGGGAGAAAATGLRVMLVDDGIGWGWIAAVVRRHDRQHARNGNGWTRRSVALGNVTLLPADDGVWILRP